MIGLDSDCIIDFLKGSPKAIEIIKEYRTELVTTELNAFEVFFGIYIKKVKNEQEEESAKIFFDIIPVLNGGGWGENGAGMMSDLIKKGKIIEQNDILISSILKANGCYSIITKNKKHFSQIKGMNVITY